MNKKSEIQKPEMDLVPVEDFREAMKKILATNKKDSDEHIDRLQAENAKNRRGKKG